MITFICTVDHDLDGLHDHAFYILQLRDLSDLQAQLERSEQMESALHYQVSHLLPLGAEVTNLHCQVAWLHGQVDILMSLVNPPRPAATYDCSALYSATPRLP